MKAGSQQFACKQDEVASLLLSHDGRHLPTMLEVPAAKDTPELTALMNSEAGFAYGTARGNAIDSLATGLDGQVQLLFNDRQASLLQEIGNEAKACATGHK